ncbi:MAG: hypothetical protein ACFE0P_05055 [Oceanicaulis sp.]
MTEPARLRPPPDGHYVIDLTGPLSRSVSRSGVYSSAAPPDWRLDPGAYRLNFRRIEDGPSQVFRAVVELAPGETLDLSDIVRRQAPRVLGAPLAASRRSGEAPTQAAPAAGPEPSPSPTDRTAPERWGEYLADDGGPELAAGFVPAIFARPLKGRGLKADPDGAFFDDVAPAAAPARNRISIAMSVQDPRPGGDPDAAGGWTGPQDLVTDQISSTEWRIKPSPGAKLERRLRVSLSVEGRAVVRFSAPLFGGGLLVFLKRVGQDDPVGAALAGSDSPDASDLARRITIGVTAIDPHVQTLVGALDESADVADQVLSQVVGAGRDGIDLSDPWAAIATSLLLTHAGLNEARTSAVERVCARFPWCAEALILHALLEARADVGEKGRAESACLERLLAADRAGAPTFFMAETLAARLLKALWYTASETRVRDKAGDAYRRRLKRQGRRLRAGPYFAWEQAGERLRAGRFPDKRYHIIFEGELASLPLAG